jgi:hypothetical protein
MTRKRHLLLVEPLGDPLPQRNVPGARTLQEVGASSGRSLPRLADDPVSSTVLGSHGNRQSMPIRLLPKNENAGISLVTNKGKHVCKIPVWEVTG